MNEIIMKGIYDMVLSLVTLMILFAAGYLVGQIRTEREYEKRGYRIKPKHSNTKAQFIDVHDINYDWVLTKALSFLRDIFKVFNDRKGGINYEKTVTKFKKEKGLG